MFLSKPSKAAQEIIDSGKHSDAKIMDIRKSDLIRGVRLHESHYVFIVHETVMVILPIDPRDPRTDDYKIDNSNTRNGLIGFIINLLKGRQ